MFQGTLIYFSHGLGWLEGIRVIHELMEAIGARPRPWGGEGEIYSLTGHPQYDYVSQPSHEAILNAQSVHVAYDSQLEKVCENRINSTYSFIYNTQENIWRMDYDINLLPQAVYDAKGNDGEGNPMKCNYKLAEVLKFYDLVKYLHLELKSELTAGSDLDDFMTFGEDSGTFYGYDSILRFDRNGWCRLIAPYEERRDIVDADLDSSKIDGNIVRKWCLDSKEPMKIKVSAEFSEFLNKAINL